MDQVTILFFGIAIGVILTLGYITLASRRRPTTAKVPSPSPTAAPTPTEKKQKEAPAPRQMALWMALAPREREVALLVARGYSNQEAARTLQISPRTVDSYLRNVYRKLEIHSRTELANFVNALGL